MRYIRLRKYKDAIEALERVLELSRLEDVIYEANRPLLRQASEPRTGKVLLQESLAS